MSYTETVRTAILLLCVLVISACGHPTPKSQPTIPVSQLVALVPTGLRLEPVRIADSANGAVLAMRAAGLSGDWQAIANAMPKGAGDFAIADEAKEVLQTLESVRKPLDLLKQASRERWVLPKRDPFDPDFKFDAKLKFMVRTLVFRGQARIYLGQQVEGAEDLLAARNAGIRMIEGRGLMLDGLVGIALIAIADRMIGRECGYPKQKPEALRLLLKGIRAPSAIDRGMQDELRAEIVDGSVQSLATGPDPVFDPKELSQAMMGKAAQIIRLAKQLSHPFDRKDTFTAESKGFDIAVRNLERPWAQQQSLAPYVAGLAKGWPRGILDNDHKVTESDLADARGDLEGMPNPVGRLLVAKELGLLIQVAEASFRCRCRQEATRATLGIRIWRDAHGGTFPPTLEALVKAGILKQVPFDFFANGPLHYDPRREILWSVGSDGIDDGGNDKPWQAIGVKDLVWTATGA